jgi:hypothetical protein
MANTPEAVGRLLANSALMNGERELLRRRDGPAAETSPTAAQPKAPPIDTENKAVTAVLLTLLDEQLHAAESAAAPQSKSQSPADGDTSASKLAATRYATDGFVRSDDAGLPEPKASTDQVRMQAMPYVVSADLQAFVQRQAASAAERSRAAQENLGAFGGAASLLALVSRVSPLGFAVIAAALLWLVAMIVQWAGG